MTLLHPTILRSFLTGCLLPQGGGGLLRGGGGDSDESCGSDDSGVIVAAAQQLQSLHSSTSPVIKLAPLNDDISQFFDRVMLVDDVNKTVEESGEIMSLDTDNMSVSSLQNIDDNAINTMLQQKLSSYSLDCYPYTFSPLLLFTTNQYFDRGYSNYNAVAAFFHPALADLGLLAMIHHDDDEKVKDHHSPTRSPPRKTPRSSCHFSNSHNDTPHNYEGEGSGINMLHGVIYDRKNMTYDELYNHIVSTQSLVTCCIDAHFTSFQILFGPSSHNNKLYLIYYDPLNPGIRVARGEEDVQTAALFLLMKCKYGDDVHVQENQKYYTGNSASSLQRRV